MHIFPAIDLYEGSAVRLFQGDYKQMTVYSREPLTVAAAFRKAGADYIHVVDLEGAKTGETPNFETVARIAAESGARVEIGGGVRSAAVVERYLNAGVWRVILGTAAITSPGFVQEMVAKWGDRIAVGVDVRDGMVAIKGWTETSDTSCFAFCEQLAKWGVGGIICTDISKDGAMGGTNRELYHRLTRQFSMGVVASGGVSSMVDLLALREMGLFGAIVGKAYYTGDIDLKAAIAAMEA